ncbi:MAG: redoxin domain-containing protein [Sphingobacteriia bacterium]|nr:redoxin domain-containing protein [Sphingobacteriia bacterium]
MKQVFLRLAACLLIPISLCAQQTVSNKKSFNIGDTCPNLEFRNLLHYSAPTAKLSDFRGKLVILDFWASWCLPCVATLPKIDSLQKVFKDKLQIIGISKESADKIQTFLAKRKEIVGREMRYTTTTVDTTNFDLFDVRFLPHYMWVDTAGKIVGFTSDRELTAQNIRQYIDHGDIVFKQAERRQLIDFDGQAPLFINGNAGKVDNMVFHSILTKRNPQLSGGGFIWKKRLLFINYPKLYLYQCAYGGMKAEFDMVIGFPENRTILNFKDTTISFTLPLKDPAAMRQWQLDNSHCYELILPGYNRERAGMIKQPELYKAMQQDLDRYFPIQAKIEVRRVKCLVLVRTSKQLKVVSKGGDAFSQKDAYSYTLRNASWSDFLHQLRFYYMQFDKRPMLDETGLTGNVDMELQADMFKWESVAKGLRKYGLDIIEAERDIEMLVLSDK